MKSEEFATAMDKRKKKGEIWTWRMLLCAAFFTLHSSLFTSCSETDSTTVEFPDWKNQNEAYFERMYQAHDASTIIPKWSMVPSATPSHTDCILVDKLESGTGTTSPYYNDSVCINYVGHLLPSTSYPSGYVFDRSFNGTFDAATTAPAKLYNQTSGKYYLPSPSSFISGFTTALLHMHRGDHWRVTIPYQLGYGNSDNGAIPANSTLVFDIWLQDFWTTTKGDRD